MQLRRTNRYWVGVMIVGVILAAIWLFDRRSPFHRMPVHTLPALLSKAEASDHGASAVEKLIGDLATECNDLGKESDNRVVRQKLAALRQRLEAMPKAEAVAAIRRFLDSKANAATHLGFQLASNGQLTESPSFRVFLLDELGRVDPAAAADYAKVVLAEMGSADEWAVALRDLAWGDSSANARTMLEQKFQQMLQYAPWQQNPSTGYLQAFDVAVYLGGTDLVPTLAGLIQSQNNPAISRAAYLALDRLVINDPAEVLESLETDPTMMAGRESTRADYFARADVSNSQERQVLESYLLNPAISAAELEVFAGIFPNGNYMVSPNLLTQNATPSQGTLVSRDSESLAVVEQWAADPRFSAVAPELQTITRRLQGFPAQAGQRH